MTRDEAPFLDVPVMAPKAGQVFDVLLMPVSRPELGEIRIDEDLFAIGRGEAPFAAYPTEAVSVLSRRHARIFSEDGAVYVADLGSKNGTHVNGDAVAQQPAVLRDGDEVSFGAGLAYRVRLYPRPAEPEPPRVAVTLAPMREDLGLQPVIVTGFPFMVSKADDTFARYRDDYPHQVNYLSRRHAHLFLKQGVPWIEDLGSTNGTFVNGVRLREQSIRLEPGDVLAFGGSHFVYRVQIEYEADADATATKTSLFVAPVASPEAPQSTGAAALPVDVDPDKTTFVGAADSFLDIFCVDYRAAQEDEINPESPPDTSADAAHRPAPRGKVTMMLVEAMRSFGIRDRHQLERAARVAILVVAVVVIGGAYIWWRGAPDRSLQELVDQGKYVRAAEVADKVLSRHPDNAQYQTLGAEALMRGYVPQWSARLQANDFDGAATVAGEMRARSQNNRDGQALIAQLAWVSDLERYIAARGGVEGPVKMYADASKIRELVRWWDEDTASHQRLLGRIANDVPAFRDVYARALSDLRRLRPVARITAHTGSTPSRRAARYSSATKRRPSTPRGMAGRSRQADVPPGSSSRSGAIPQASSSGSSIQSTTAARSSNVNGGWDRTSSIPTHPPDATASTSIHPPSGRSSRTANHVVTSPCSRTSHAGHTDTAPSDRK